jgi:hypothetical protein
MIMQFDEIKVSHEQMLKDYYEVVNKVFGKDDWSSDVLSRGTGIQLRGNDLLDSINYNQMKVTPADWPAIIEKYSFWNESCPEYTKMVIESLSEYIGFNIHRVRYLQLLPGLGLPIHKDDGVRYHFPLITNPKAVFGTVSSEETFENPQIEHIPAGEHFYQVDTTKPHFVFNAGKSPRIHLVIS